MNRLSVMVLSGLLLFVGCTDRTGCLNVVSDPPGVKIWIDGEDTGFLTNHLFTDVYAGLHYVEVAWVDIGSWDDTVTVARGETTEVRIDFPTRAWKLYLDHAYFGTTTVDDDGTVFSWAENTLFAVQIDGNGRFGFPVTTPQPGSTPVTIGDDGTIYSGVGTELYAFTPTGLIKWHTPVADTSVLSGLALSADGTIYCSGGRSLVAVDPSGIVEWKTGLGSWSTCAPPIVAADGTVYVAMWSELCALTPSGSIKWRVDVGSAFESDGEVGLALGPEATVYVAVGNELRAINPDATQRWRRAFDGETRGPSVGVDGAVYVVGGHYLFALSPAGVVRWQYPSGSFYGDLSGAALGSDGTVYLSAGYLHALTSSGHLKWRYPDAVTPPAIGLDGTVGYSAPEQWFLVALKDENTPAPSSWPMFQHDARRTGRATP